MRLVTEAIIKQAISNEIVRMRNAGMDNYCVYQSQGQYTMIAGGYLDLGSIADDINRLLDGQLMK